MLGEDVQDQRGPVDHLDLDDAFQLAQLPRSQLTVADHRVGAGRGDEVGQFGGLARAYVGGSVGAAAALGEAVKHLGAGRLGEGGEFAQ